MRSFLPPTTVRRSVLILAATAGLVAPVAGATSPAGAHDRDHGAYVQTNLVSSVPGMAPLTDPNLKNPWGISFGRGKNATPLWVVNEQTATTSLYAGANGTTTGVTSPATFGTPANSTGTVFNDTKSTKSFLLPNGTPARFLFDDENGNLSGWAPGMPAAVVVKTVKGAGFTGLTLAHTKKGPRLYAADALGNRIRVFDGKFRLVRSIKGVHVPKGLSPYNVQVLDTRLYVTWAPAFPGAPAATTGVVDAYKLDGRFDRRLVVGGRVNGPWGLAIAPKHWGKFSRDLLVGNVFDGRINAFNRRTGTFKGTVKDRSGMPIVNEGLWGIAFGNGVIGTPRTLIVVAGIGDYQQGLLAAITPAKDDDDD